MKYNGKDLIPFTANEPIAFNPPKKMLCWDENDEKDPDMEPVIREVYYFNPNLIKGRVLSNGDGFASKFGVINDFCCEIPKVSNICTNKQLSEWCSKGRGEVKFSHRKYQNYIVGTHWQYCDGDGDKQVPCRCDSTTSDIRCIGIRKWGSTEWVYPTIGVVLEKESAETNTASKPNSERRFVIFEAADNDYFIKCKNFTEAKNIYELIRAYHYTGCVDAEQHGTELSIEDSYKFLSLNVYGLLESLNKPVGEAPYIVFKTSENGKIKPGLYSTGPYKLEDANKIMQKAADALEYNKSIESIYISNNTLGTTFKNIPQLEEMFGSCIRCILNPDQEWYIAFEHSNGMVYYVKLPEESDGPSIMDALCKWNMEHKFKDLKSIGLRTIADFNGYLVDKIWVSNTFGNDVYKILFGEETNPFETQEYQEYALWDDDKKTYLGIDLGVIPRYIEDHKTWYSDIKVVQEAKKSLSKRHKHLKIIRRVTTHTYSVDMNDAVEDLKDAIIDGACEAVKCPKELLTKEPENIDTQKQKAFIRVVNHLNRNLVDSPKEETTRMFSIAVRIIPESKRFNKDKKNTQVFDIGRYCSFSEASEDATKLENVIQSEKYADEKQFLTEIYCRETHSDDVLMASSDVFQVISPAFAKACIDAGVVK